MNKESFWAGVMMLILPFVLLTLTIGFISLINSGICLIHFVGGICILAYIGTALYLILRGLSEETK